MSILVTGLTKSYGDTPVLRGLDLAVAAGEVVALLGPNGAGKTTTIGILTTLIAADSGTAIVGGYDVAADPQSVRRSISVTGQSVGVDPMLTGRENLVMVGRLRGVGKADAGAGADAALAAFGLEEAGGRTARTYSGGMRRRLDLALGLLADAPVLVLDEPTTGLDTRSRAWVWDRVREAAAAGASVLVTTQYLEEADRLADRVVVLDGGVAVADDTPAALKSSVAAPRLELVTPSGDVVTHLTDGTVGHIRDLLAGAPDDATLTIRTPTLDDVFLELTTEVRS